MTKTITPKNRGSNKKIGEIERLIKVMDTLDLQPIDIAKKTSVSERTILNSIYENAPLGGKLLRGLHLEIGVSIDWVLSGTGNMMLMNNEIAENQAVYSYENPRTSRIVSFIQDWMTYANEDEQAWLETELKFNINQYRKFLENKND